MIKWLSRVFDTTDKELQRLQRTVAQANEEIVQLLESQREQIGGMREDALQAISSAGACERVGVIYTGELQKVAADARRLSGQVGSLRETIEKGEQTSRELSVLLADARTLSSMNAEKLQRPPAERRELEEEIEALVVELSEQLAGVIEAKPDLREAILRDVPKAKFHPHKPGPEEMIKQVDATASFLGREVADYFNRINETMLALRRGIALSLLPGLVPQGSACRIPSSTGDIDTAVRDLVTGLVQNDLIRHLQRQGLRLPSEIKNAAGLHEGQMPAQQDGRGRRGRDNAPAQPDVAIKDELADQLYWEEQATAELLAIACDAIAEGSQLENINNIMSRFQAREERLQARAAAFRGRILEARTDYWQGIQGRIADIVGAEALAPFLQRFEELDAEQDEMLEEVTRQDEDPTLPVMLKPEQVGDLMRRRDALEEAAFNELMNELRATDRGTHDRLKAVYDEFRKEQRKDEQRVLSELIPEVFACVWEASRRTTGMRPYDVQLMGGIVLHEGKISEMKTGEGKTLVAVAPLALNGLTARGAHLCTVNEYLIRRDSDWMGPVYKMLGMSVGAILSSMAPWERKAEYQSDITYGSNSEFGFDYLRDNISNNPDDIVQRPHHFCIVDEVDNILIDEARTPLIISGAGEGNAEVHVRAAAFAKQLRAETDYAQDEKTRSVSLTDEGIDRAEQFFKVDNLYHPDNFQLVYGVDNALKAHVLFKRDKDYVLWQEGKVVSAHERLNPKAPVEVVIVDEFTGRLMQGRRYSEGLHEAIEAKEGISVRAESQTFATITIQNYFRLYPKLAGMTGTAATEAEEFFKIYKLEVTPIPTHRPMIRLDNPDRIYRTEAAKFRAVVDEIKELHEMGRPVLVGTVSIEKSEELSKMLEEAGLPHSVLNAKQHEREASIVAQAGQRGAITIATNMAGRGTDITLGLGVHELGGLHIIGTERHESRRIDNQLRGRAGRQGDNGSSRFYVSIEDEIMRRSGVNQNIVNSNIFKSLWEEDLPIEHSMISRSVEQAQVKMEGFNFDTRKHLVEYDDVVNSQRDYVYSDRRYILKQGDPRLIIGEMLAAKVQDIGTQAVGGDGKNKRSAVPGGYGVMFDALREAFPTEIVRRLLKSVVHARLMPLAEEGDVEGLVEELHQVADEAYEGVLDTQIREMDEKLKDFYHIGDVYYEVAGEGTVDYNKLSRTLGLPPNLIQEMQDEEMGYEDALEFLGEIMREGYEKQQQPRLDQLKKHISEEARKLAGKGQESPTAHAVDLRVRGLLETIDGNFNLSSASAVRYVEAERGQGGGGRSSMMDMGGSDSVVDEVQEQLEALYAEVEQTLGDVFMETNQQMPLIAMVDNRLPRSVYRQIEERLGLEGLEQVENIPLSQLPDEVAAIVKEAFVRWQEADLMLRVIDYLWTRHLTTMEGLRHSIGLQAYGQKDPLIQYKIKAYDLFEDLKGEIRQLVVLNVLLMGEKAEAARAQNRQAAQAQHQAAQQAAAAPPQPARVGVGAGAGNGRSGHGGNGKQHGKGQQAQRPSNQAPRPAQPTPVGAGAAMKGKVGRNDPCFCGSGRKYKHCHGR
jgi:preprotein translocase subunit SecA